MAAHLAGAYPIIAVARNPKRLELALELGATHVVNAARRGRGRPDAGDRAQVGSATFSTARAP